MPTEGEEGSPWLSYLKWRHNIQHNDTQQNDTQHNDTYHNGAQQNDKVEWHSAVRHKHNDGI